MADIIKYIASFSEDAIGYYALQLLEVGGHYYENENGGISGDDEQ